ncbi:hypothetical protein [Rahnella sp. R3(2024)]|uniref:hypothetical protein n=1 Tax=Rahnella sp. R3(2024) TaxID=3163550 RepID=UPI0036E12849
MKFKNPLIRFRISHIFCISMGIVITEGFNWLFFKDPKKITPAGFSALIALSAFILAIHSAYRVNKWLDSKVNEKGFKKCEHIIDTIAIIKEKIVTIYPYIHIAKNHNLKGFDTNQDYLKQSKIDNKVISETIDLIQEDIYTTLSLQNQLEVWGFKYNEGFYAFPLTEFMIDIGHNVDIFYEFIENSIPVKHNEFIETFNLFEENYHSALKFCTKIMTTEFDQIFTNSRK